MRCRKRRRRRWVCASAQHLCMAPHALVLNVQPPCARVEYIIKILGLQRCADTVVGNAMVRGVSGGEKKRVTTGEILVGGARVLLMDEISTGAVTCA